MIEFEFKKKDMDDMKRRFKQYSTLPRRFLLDLTEFARTTMVKDVLSGQILHARSELLRGSIQSAVDPKGDVGIVGSGVKNRLARVKYANIHATGGTIRAKRGYLAIPTRHVLTGSKAQLKGNATSVREFLGSLKKGTWFIRHGIAWRKKGKSGIVPMFIFRKSVTIPKRDYITATMNIVAGKSSEIFRGSLAKVEAGKA